MDGGKDGPDLASVFFLLMSGKVLGAGLGDAAEWDVWLSVLKAAYGLLPTENEGAIFDSFPAAERHRWRPSPSFEFGAGRRSGKSRVAGALCVYEAMLKRHKPTKDQAVQVLSHAKGFIEASPLLSWQVDERVHMERGRGGAARFMPKRDFNKVGLNAEIDFSRAVVSGPAPHASEHALVSCLRKVSRVAILRRPNAQRLAVAIFCCSSSLIRCVA
jgi:hypothetical protein